MYLRAIGVTSSCRLNDSDTFESPSSYTCSQSLAATLGDLRGSHSTTTLPCDLPASECVTGNTPDEKCGKDGTNLDTASPASKHSRTHSLGEAFLKQKLKLLQVKLHSAPAESVTDYITTNTGIQASTPGCIKQSNTQENTYIEASLCRLRDGHAACVIEHSSASYGTQKRLHGNPEVFSRQCEMLRIESLKNRMKADIKVGCIHMLCNILEFYFFPICRG